MTRAGKIVLAISLAIIIPALVAGTNFVAGAIVFGLHKQSPLNTEFTSIQQAWAEADTPEDKKKVKIASLLAALLCFGLPGALVFIALSGKKQSLHGDARFANDKDIAKEGLHSPQGILLGKQNGKFLRLPGYEFVLVAAATRTGKGVGFVIPNLLTFEGSSVVLDVKGENYNLTGQYRHQHLGNEVFYFNPFSESTKRWNPLSYVSKDSNFRVNDLQALAKMIYPANPKDPFWPESAANLFVAIGLMVLESPHLPHTLGEMLRQGTGKGQQLSDYLRHVMSIRASTGTPLSTACVNSLNLFLNNPDNTLKNILASFVAPLSLFSNAVIDKATSADDFDLRDVRKKKMTIYMHIPANEVIQAGFILNLFFSQLINENLRELPEQNPQLKYQCLLMLDEATLAGKIAPIAKSVGVMAGYNMRLAIIIQDRSQLESVYGKEDAHNIVSNMGAMIAFTPRQLKEAEEYSKLIGNMTVKSTSKQRAITGASNRSETVADQSRAVMLPQELIAMDTKRELIVRGGMPIINADKILYYADPFFSKRFNSVEMQEVFINGTPRMVPKPRQLPPKNWRVFKASLDRSDYYLQEDFSDLNAPVAAGKVDNDEISILNHLNRNSQKMDEHQLDTLTAELVRIKVAQFEAMFERGQSVVF